MYGLLDDTDNLVNNKPIAQYNKPGPVTLPNGNQLPANWMQLFSQEEKEAIHIWPLTSTVWDTSREYLTGIDTFSFNGINIHQVLGIAPNAEPLSLNRYKDKAYIRVDSYADSLVVLAEQTPSISEDYTDDPQGKTRADKKRINQAKSNTAMSNSDDNLADHIDLIFDAAELIRDDVENATEYDAVDLVLTNMSADVRWPTWTPVTL